MAFKDQETNWRFTIPQEGEVDSCEAFRRHIHEIDNAILSPAQKEQLTSRGADAIHEDGDGFERDEFLSGLEGRDVWVTDLHRHPSPEFVPQAKYAEEAGRASQADEAARAERLSPGFSINGHHTDGNPDTLAGGDVTIRLQDIPDAPRVFYGTAQNPNGATNLPTELRDGDIYFCVDPL